MYKCNRNGELKEELPRVIERYPYGDTYVCEFYDDDSCTCGGEFEKAIQCDNCGEWFLEDELVGFKYHLCNDCKDDIYEETVMRNFINEDDDSVEQFVDYAMERSNVNV